MTAIQYALTGNFVFLSLMNNETSNSTVWKFLIWYTYLYCRSTNNLKLHTGKHGQAMHPEVRNLLSHAKINWRSLNQVDKPHIYWTISKSVGFVDDCSIRWASSQSHLRKCSTYTFGTSFKRNLIVLSDEISDSSRSLFSWQVLCFC